MKDSREPPPASPRLTLRSPPHHRQRTKMAGFSRTGDVSANYAGCFDGHLTFGRSPALLIIDFVQVREAEVSGLCIP